MYILVCLVMRSLKVHKLYSHAVMHIIGETSLMQLVPSVHCELEDNTEMHRMLLNKTRFLTSSVQFSSLSHVQLFATP